MVFPQFAHRVVERDLGGVARGGDRMAVVVVVVNDSDGRHAARQTQGQSYGREAENGTARQRGQGTHWIVLPVRGVGSSSDVVTCRGADPKGLGQHADAELLGCELAAAVVDPDGEGEGSRCRGCAPDTTGDACTDRPWRERACDVRPRVRRHTSAQEQTDLVRDPTVPSVSWSVPFVITRGLAGSTVSVKVLVAVLPAPSRALTVNVVVSTRVGTPVTAVVWVSRRSLPATFRPFGTVPLMSDHRKGRALAAARLDEPGVISPTLAFGSGDCVVILNSD